MKRDHDERDKRIAILEEEKKNWENCLERIAATGDGKYLFKLLIRYCGLHSFNTKIDPAKLVEDEAKRKVYLELFRPYLNKSTLAELENQ